MKKYARIIAVVMIAFIMLQCNKSEAAKPGTENQAKTSQNISGKENHKHNDKDVLIVTTGSQGETMSALYRMATDEHRHIKIKPTDQIIISAKAIPGNEGSVSKVLNFLLKSGANVAYQDFSEIHVSGHAAQEEQKLILRLVKPRFFLPVHGEYNHISKHKETAMQCGIPERNIYLMSDGDQVEVCAKYMKKIKTIKTGKVFIDNQINEQIEIQTKYAGYIAKAKRDAKHLQQMEKMKLAHDLDYENMDNLSLEARQKLTEIRPLTLGQASRISGINPSDIAILAMRVK